MVGVQQHLEQLEEADQRQQDRQVGYKSTLTELSVGFHCGYNMAHEIVWLKEIFGGLFALILGAFGYTRSVSKNAHARIDKVDEKLDKLATKEDLQSLREKVCSDSEKVQKDVRMLVDHLLKK